MKTIFTTLLILITFSSTAQTSTFLDSSEVANRFNEAVLKQYNINYPIYRVYEFNDELGKHELVLTERPSTNKNIDSIQAFCFLIEESAKKLEWKLRDFIINQENASEETSIWFWTKYLRLEDLNDDGKIDPVIVYGSKSRYGTENGRLKILLYINGQKHGIRHQNSGMDFGRNTRVDQSFYKLGVKAQNFVTDLMHVIYDGGNTIFPAGWEDNMKLQKLYFDEN